MGAAMALDLGDRPSVTVRDVLAMSSVQRGEPQVSVGGASLDTPIRWVHIISESGIASLIEGGELILTTGAAWPAADDDLVAEVNELINANIAGLMIELGTRFHEVPERLRDLCHKRNIALVALRKQTPFVQITEQVHRALLIEQSEALAARDDVQSMLTRLGLNRAPVDFVVEQLAEVLQAPVIFENDLGEVISWANPLPGSSAAETLARWPRNLNETLDASWSHVPVEARDTRWGSLIACAGPPHPAGRQTVLELGAVALALGRLANPLSAGESAVPVEADSLLDAIMSGRYRSDTDVMAQLTAAGVQLGAVSVRAVSIQVFDAAEADVNAELGSVLQAVQLALGPRARLLVTRPQPRDGRVLGILSSGLTQPSAAHTLPLSAHAIDRQLSMLSGAAAGNVQITLGPDAATVPELVASMQITFAARVFVATETSQRVALSDVARQPLAYLLSEMKTDLRLQRFAHSVLGDLLAHDLAHRADLTQVLRAYVAHPTNRSDAARAAGLSRSVFYQRIARIEELLDVDLTDGTVIATLYLALALTPQSLFTP